MGIDFLDDIVEDVGDFFEDTVDFVQEGISSLLGLDIPDPPEALDGALVTKTGAVQPLPIIGGLRRVGGTLINMEVTGVDNEYLWMIYALADGDTPVSKISNDVTDGEILVNDVPLSDAKFSGLYLIETGLGGHTTQPFTTYQSESAVWTSDHRLLGTACLAIRFKWDSNAFSGLPRLSFPVVGNALLDLDALPTETLRRSDNPAEFLFGYLTNDVNGKGLSKVDGVDIDLQSFKDARDYSDDLITSYSGGPAHKRFACNILLDTTKTVKENISLILKTCRGSLPYINGVYYLIIEKHYTLADYGIGSYFDFNTDNIIGGWNFKVGDIGARYNRVKVTFPNEAFDYKADYIVVESSAFRAEDGRLLEKSLTLEGTTNVYRAIDTASVILRRSRQQIIANFIATPQARQVTAGTVVTVTHPTPGWTAKQFRISKMELLSSGNCGITLVEHEETVYDLSVPNEANTSLDTTLPDPSVVPTLATPTLTSDETVLKVATDGTLIPQIRVVWVAPTNIFVNGYDLEFKLSSDSVWLVGASPNSIGTTEAFIPNVTELSDYDIRVRARNSGGFKGAWTTVSNHTVIGKTSKPSDVTGFIVLQREGSVVFRWNLPSDKDSFGFDIRYGPQGTSTWQDAITLTEATRGTNVTSADVSPGDWTFFIKQIDTSGNESVNAASSDILVSNEQIVIAQQSSAPAWEGTLTGFVRHPTGVLVPESTSDNTTIGWRVFDEFVPDPIASATYEGAEIDVDFDDTLRVWGELTAVLGPGETGQANPTFQIDTKLDGDAYSGYSDWSGGRIEFRYLKGKLVLSTDNGVAYIKAMDVTVDVAERIQRVEGITVAASGQAIVFPRQYHTVPFVQPYYVGSSILIPTLTSVTGTGFTLHLYNTSGADVGGTGGAYQAAGG